MEAMAALKEVCVLYSANVWGETAQTIGFKKYGRLCRHEDGTSTQFRVSMGHESVMYTVVHSSSQNIKRTLQIYFKPSESDPTRGGKYFVKIYHANEQMFHGSGIYSDGIPPILNQFRWLAQ